MIQCDAELSIEACVTRATRHAAPNAADDARLYILSSLCCEHRDPNILDQFVQLVERVVITDGGVRCIVRHEMASEIW